MKKLYEIEILKYVQHNKKHKPNYPYIMLSKRFFDDAKIQSLPASGRLLYIFLLLRRGDVDTTLFVCSHDDCTMSAGGRGVVVETLLDQLESLQLLRYTKLSPNRKEKKEKEKKIKEIPAGQNEEPQQVELLEPEIIKPDIPKPQKVKVEKVIEPDRGVKERREIKQAYVNAYRLRWKVDPATENATFNSQIKTLHTKFGVSDAIGIVDFYLKHNDTKYIAAFHSIGMCVLNGDSLRTQMLRGKAVTLSEIRKSEKVFDQLNQLEEAKKGGF